MSLLSSHRLHWGSHHELTDHFWIIVDHLVHPSADTAPQPSGQQSETDSPADRQPGTTTDAHLEILGP